MVFSLDHAVEYEVADVPVPLQDAHDYYRYCPGEERVKLSDAVCLGRRRSNFPKCKGCPFNDGEKQGGNAVATDEDSTRGGDSGKKKRDCIKSVFRSCYVRATCPDPLDTQIAWRIGHAAAQFLRSELRGYDRSQLVQSTIIVGRDMRKSSPDLAGALIEGLRAGGAPVIDIGMVDTPQLYYAVNHLTCCGGVQVTASRATARYNGFKFCGKKSRPISDDTGLGKIYKIAKNTMRHVSSQVADLSQQDLTESYKVFVRQFLKPNGAFNEDRPLKVVVDASNGMAGRCFPLLFGDVDWLEIVRLNFEHNGEFVHDPDPSIESNLAQLKDRMDRSKADFGICFDGDADQCVMVDNEGQTIPADLMTALMAQYSLRESAGSIVAYDLRSSRVVAEEIRRAGGVPRRERSGPLFIRKALADTKGLFGAELTGHYCFRDNGYCDSGMIAFAQVANILSESGKTLSDLVAPLKRYARSGQRSFQNDDPKSTIKKLVQKYSTGQIDYLDGITVEYDDWWFHVRPSDTEPLLQLHAEAATKRMLDSKLKELYPLLGEPQDE